MHVIYSTIVAFVLLIGAATMSMAALPPKSDAHASPAAASGKFVRIECDGLNKVATPKFLAEAERDAATLSPTSPLVGLHRLMKMSLAHCNDGRK